MGLQQLNFEGKNKVEVAVRRLQEFEPTEGYYLCNSGGVDSEATDHLTRVSGVKFDAHYNVSPIDPPEIRSFLRTNYPDVSWDFNARGFWKRFMTEGPPMRHMRWCCELIKEAGGIGRTKVLGTRRLESTRRRGYTEYDPSWKHANTYFLRPIFDWTRNEVWEYISLNSLSYCSLYDEGLTRLGCVLCPFEPESVTRVNLNRFPKIVANWRRAFERYYQVRIERGTPLTFKDSEEYWQWWLTRGKKLT